MRYDDKDVDLKITVTVSGKHEGNDSPWWMIINPRQNLHTCQDRGVHNIANMITGPFFSRESAQAHLDARRHAFGKNACVFAHSGYYSQEYKEAIRTARAGNPAASGISTIKDLIEAIEGMETPEANCSCHIAAPCGDCETYGHIRVTLKEAREYLAKMEKK